MKEEVTPVNPWTKISRVETEEPSYERTAAVPTVTPRNMGVGPIPGGRVKAPPLPRPNAPHVYRRDWSTFMLAVGVLGAVLVFVLLRVVA